MSLPSGRIPAGAPDDVRPRARTAEWFSAARGGEGLHYLHVLRSRIWFIVLVLAVTVGSAALALATADKVYEAEADLYITPVPRDSPELIGIPGLLRESTDPTREAETVARLVKTPAVARRVRERLALERSPEQLLGDVSVDPVAQSNIVSITAKAADPELAARLANAFGDAFVAERTARLRTELDRMIPRLQKELGTLPAAERAESGLRSRLRALQVLRAGDDPTVRVETLAEVPTEPAAPRLVLSIAAAVFGALILGVGSALGIELLKPRVRREEQLRRYRIPILARIPLERGRLRRNRGPLLPHELTLPAQDAYRLLGATLTATFDEGAAHAVLVTGPTPSTGKTTTAINLAGSLAAASKRVILIEGDSRRPSVGPKLGLEPQHGVSSVVAGRVALREALVRADGLVPRLRVLLQEREDAPQSALMSPASAETLVLAGERLADWLIFDAPALNLVPDALAMAKRVDNVVVVVRLGATLERDLEELAELLAQQDITPTGFVVVGGLERHAYTYSYHRRR